MSDISADKYFNKNAISLYINIESIFGDINIQMKYIFIVLIIIITLLEITRKVIRNIMCDYFA